MRAGAQSGLRAYVPNVMYGDWAPSMAAEDGREPLKPLPMSTVLGLALVAVRDVRDEELLLNYRCGIAFLAACCTFAKNDFVFCCKSNIARRFNLI